MSLLIVLGLGAVSLPQCVVVQSVRSRTKNIDGGSKLLILHLRAMISTVGSFICPVLWTVGHSD